MTDHPINVVVVDGVDVPKPDFRAYMKARARLMVVSAAEVNGKDYSDAAGIDLDGTFYDADLTDTTTPDDGGVTCIVDSAGTRFKIVAPIGGVLFERVRLVDTAGGAIATAYAAGQTVDGKLIVAGDLILRASSAGDPSDGIYLAPASGAASRLRAFSAYDSMPGCYVSVMEGTSNADALWRCTSDKGGTLGTTSILFSKFVPDTSGRYVVTDYGADPNGSSDSASAIQSAINECYAAGVPGGIVYFPPGHYKIGSTLTVPPMVHLFGSGKSNTSIDSSALDITAISFTSVGVHSGMRDLAVFGTQLSTSTANLITVASNGLVDIENCDLWGGKFALQNAGVDGSIENCFIQGFGSNGGNVYSTGANWYRRVKFDDQGQSHLYGFQQISGASICENHFELCDFTGNFTDSIAIQDTTANSITYFEGCIFAKPCDIETSQWTCFNGCEFNGGAGQFAVNANAQVVTIANSYAFSSCTATGGASMLKSNNYNIA